MSTSDRSAVHDRAKRMAKRLHDLGQQSPLDVSQLAKAQAVTAKLFGFPSWHALTTTERPPVTPASVERPGTPMGSSPRVLMVNQPEALKKTLSWAMENHDLKNHEPLTVISPEKMSPFRAPNDSVLSVLSTRALLKTFDPFTLPLGVHCPDTPLLSALLQWVSMVVLPDYPETDHSRSMMMGFLSHMLTESYKSLAPGKFPRLYHPGRLKAVDRLIEEWRDPEVAPTWWEVCEELMRRHQWSLAAQAQVQASPSWESFVGTLTTEVFQQMYGDLRISATSEALIPWMIRRLTLVYEGAQPKVHQEEAQSLAHLPEHVWLHVELDPTLPELAWLSTEARWGLAWLGGEMARWCPRNKWMASTLSPNLLPVRYLGAFHGKSGGGRQPDDVVFALGSPYAAWHEARRSKCQRHLIWWEGQEIIAPDMRYLHETQALMVQEERPGHGHVLAWGTAFPSIPEVLRQLSTHENPSVHDWLPLQWPTPIKAQP